MQRIIRCSSRRATNNATHYSLQPGSFILHPSSFILSFGVVHVVAALHFSAHQCTPMHIISVRAHECTASDLACTPTVHIISCSVHTKSLAAY
jgi:hypothetical protein